ncbi:MAG TPA: hypothetical protein DCE41_13845 [Cytophagales bacterium]|nr:hypothetical protein [Cytophagales bacterium]HAA19970.1 hypothetical protein [Cytophagales bacterium]HAP63619.1 hypothetical protein [Cytophagales bacterium]
MADDPKKPELDENSHSFSAALLAPITSLFEAQVHSARSFLSFLLQMSFGHRPVPGYDDDGDGIPNNQDTDNNTPPPQREEMWTQDFPYKDAEGNTQTISIPNIALLPIKPLAVEDASFEFDWEVRTSSEEYTVIKESTKSSKRPWYLIKEPKRLKGNFTQKGTHESGSRTAISVKVNVGTSTMPYGLERLLTHFTNNVDMIQPGDGNAQQASDITDPATSPNTGTEEGSSDTTKE